MVYTVTTLIVVKEIESDSYREFSDYEEAKAYLIAQIDALERLDSISYHKVTLESDCFT